MIQMRVFPSGQLEEGPDQSPSGGHREEHERQQKSNTDGLLWLNG